MIEKTSNIKKDKALSRIIETDIENAQITILDSRYYRRKPEVYYPSVTYVLSYFPKDKFFETWVKDVGHNADIIIRKAGEDGTQVHKAAEDFVKGKKVEWIDEYGNVKYSLEVWKMILRFADFWQTHKPKLIHSETLLFTDELGVAGTGDLIVELNEKLWLIDIKTSNSLHETYDLQVSVYKKAWDEFNERKIDHTGILWLKAATRGPDKTGKKIQGAGWQLKPTEGSFDTHIATFKNLLEIFKFKNPELKPYSEIYPTSIKLA